MYSQSFAFPRLILRDASFVPVSLPFVRPSIKVRGDILGVRLSMGPRLIFSKKFVASTNRNKRGIRSNVITFFDRIERLIKSPGRERARFLKSVFSLKRLITSCLCPPAYAPSPPRYFRRPVKERRLIFASSLNGGAGVISTKNSTSETDFPPRTIEYLE